MFLEDAIEVVGERVASGIEVNGGGEGLDV